MTSTTYQLNDSTPFPAFNRYCPTQLLANWLAMRPLRSPCFCDQRMAASLQAASQGTSAPWRAASVPTHWLTTSRYCPWLKGWKETQIPNRPENDIFSSTDSR